MPRPRFLPLADLLAGLGSALPFLGAVLMVAGFGIAIYPLISHGLVVFAEQSALGMDAAAQAPVMVAMVPHG